jgi:hypothetical protein
MTTETKTSDNAADITLDPPHPRDVVCEKAGPELFTILQEWQARHGLSPWEFIYLLNVVIGRHAQHLCVVERGGE